MEKKKRSKVYAIKSRMIDHELHRVLNFSIKDPVLQVNFINAYLNFAGEPEKFWEQLIEKKVLTEEQIESLQFTNQLSALTGNHIPLMEELQVKQGKNSSLQLLELSKKDWEKILDKIGWPDNIKDSKQAKKTYVKEIQDFLHSAYPKEKMVLQFLKDFDPSCR